MNDLIAKTQLLKRTGLTGRTLARWVEMKLVPPPLVTKHPQGKGTMGYYPEWAIEVIAEVQRRESAGELLEDIAASMENETSKSVQEGFQAVALALVGAVSDEEVTRARAACKKGGPRVTAEIVAQWAAAFRAARAHADRIGSASERRTRWMKWCNRAMAADAAREGTMADIMERLAAMRGDPDEDPESIEAMESLLGELRGRK